MSLNKIGVALVVLFLAASNVSFAESRSSHPSIVGGTQITDQTKVPFLVQLYAAGTGVECGGSVIAPTWILTAGHCQEVVSKITAIGGSLIEGSGTKLKIIAHYVHPQFKETQKSVSYDFMLLELSAPIDFANSKIKPIVLATADAANRGLDDPGQMMTVAGWGDLKENAGDYPKNAYSVQVPIVSNQDANASTAYNGAIGASSIAAGYPNGGKDSCDGDSGGPLFAFDPVQKENVLVGVVSFGQGCAEAHKYGIYGRVTAGYDWITQTMAAHPPAEKAPKPPKEPKRG
jgi:trypsin